MPLHVRRVLGQQPFQQGAGGGGVAVLMLMVLIRPRVPVLAAAAAGVLAAALLIAPLVPGAITGDAVSRTVTTVHSALVSRGCDRLVRRLTLPHEMGEAFKVLALGRK